MTGDPGRPPWGSGDLLTARVNQANRKPRAPATTSRRDRSSQLQGEYDMKHTLSETLDLAADLVRDKGWTQGASGWEGPRVCLEGAIAAASGLDVFADGIGTMAVNQCPAGRAVRRHLCYYGMLWAWNDREGRTAVEVEGVLRSAAAAERAKEQAAVDAAESVADSFHRSLDRALAVTS